MHDPVNSPSHYADENGGIECIEAIEASMSVEEFKGFLKGNSLKYLWRYSKKNGVEDLKKAKWYLKRLTFICEQEEEAEASKLAEKSKDCEDDTKFFVNYDPDDHLVLSGCTDGFCPMPSVRQGPVEPLFDAVK